MQMISVIVPIYNRPHLLRRCLNSILNQTYQDFDLWIIDDGSDGPTEVGGESEEEKIVEELRKSLSDSRAERLHYLKTEHLGVSAARNRGIQASQGEWIAFLDSDDEWLPHKLSDQMSFLQQTDNRHLKIVHGEEIWIRHGVRVNPMKKHQKGGGDQFVRSLSLCVMGPSTVLMHRSLFDQVGFFREDYLVCEDYDLWLRITSRFPVGFIPNPVTIKYGGHEDQLSRKFVAMDYWRVKSLAEVYQNVDLSEERRLALLSVLKKKCHILIKGYQKHAHWDKSEEMAELLQRTLNWEKDFILCP